MQQRVNVTLPIETEEQANLEQKLKEGAIRHAERDLQMAEEWLPLKEEAWQKDQK